MTWGVDEVKDILLAVLRLVNGADCLGFDRDAALALQLHVVEDLGLHLTAGQKTGLLDNAVRQRGFTVVDMGNDTEISDFILGIMNHSCSSLLYDFFFYMIHFSAAGHHKFLH